jgi:hypothetical protein
MVPTELLFWGVMSLGVIVGFIVAYPANVWMVQRGLKHGLMTGRTKPAEHQGAHGSFGISVAISPDGRHERQQVAQQERALPAHVRHFSYNCSEYNERLPVGDGAHSS